MFRSRSSRWNRPRILSDTVLDSVGREVTGPLGRPVGRRITTGGVLSFRRYISGQVQRGNGVFDGRFRPAVRLFSHRIGDRPGRRVKRVSTQTDDLDIYRSHTAFQHVRAPRVADETRVRCPYLGESVRRVWLLRQERRLRHIAARGGRGVKNETTRIRRHAAKTTFRETRFAFVTLKRSLPSTYTVPVRKAKKNERMCDVTENNADESSTMNEYAQKTIEITRSVVTYPTDVRSTNKS